MNSPMDDTWSHIFLAGTGICYCSQLLVAYLRSRLRSCNYHNQEVYREFCIQRTCWCVCLASELRRILRALVLRKYRHFCLESRSRLDGALSPLCWPGVSQITSQGGQCYRPRHCPVAKIRWVVVDICSSNERPWYNFWWSNNPRKYWNNGSWFWPGQLSECL